MGAELALITYDETVNGFESIVRSRVQKGCEWLHENAPTRSWWHCISIKDLDMRLQEGCVFSHIFGNYRSALRELHRCDFITLKLQIPEDICGPEINRYCEVELGMFAPEDLDGYELEEYYRTLQDVWLEAITQLLTVRAW